MTTRSLLLLIILIGVIVALLPMWPYSAPYGFYPSGGLMLLLIVLIILIVTKAI